MEKESEIENIDKWIQEHKEDMVTDIQKLVQYRSISKKTKGLFRYGKESAKVLDVMLNMGKEYGFQSKNHEYYCGSITYGQGEETIGIWNHLDVVAAGDEWEFNPFECTRKGDFIIGRGVQDNKGPAIAVLYALRCIKELKIPINSRIIQILGCNEENGMEDVAYYLSHYPIPDFSIIADCGFPVCFGEKGICEILLTTKLSNSIVDVHGGNASNIVPDKASITVTNQQGMQKKCNKLPKTCKYTHEPENWRFEATGVSGHVAFPEKAQNAIGILLEDICNNGIIGIEDNEKLSFLKRICSENYGESLGIAYEDEFYGKLTCIGSIVRMHQSELKLQLNIRYPLLVKLNEMVKSIKIEAMQYNYKVNLLSNQTPSYFDKESRYVKVLMDTYNQVMGEEAKPYTMGGGSYAKKIPNAVGFGPGLPMDIGDLNLMQGHGSCHAPDEAQSITNLCKATKIYIIALIALDKELVQTKLRNGRKNHEENINRKRND